MCECSVSVTVERRHVIVLSEKTWNKPPTCSLGDTTPRTTYWQLVRQAIGVVGLLPNGILFEDLV